MMLAAPGSKENILPDEQLGKNLKFDKPATYRTRVTGHIDDSLPGQLGKMVITRAFTADSRPIPILVGLMSDHGGAQRTLRAAPAAADHRVPPLKEMRGKTTVYRSVRRRTGADQRSVKYLLRMKLPAASYGVSKRNTGNLAPSPYLSPRGREIV
jgi:hypothetical protein